MTCAGSHHWGTESGPKPGPPVPKMGFLFFFSPQEQSYFCPSVTSMETDKITGRGFQTGALDCSRSQPYLRASKGNPS